MSLGLTERWAQFGSELRYERLPAEAVRVAKCLLLDTIGTTLAGGSLGDCAQQVARFVEQNAGVEEVTVLGYRKRVAPLTAAFANGVFAHSLNYDAMGAEVGT